MSDFTRQALSAVCLETAIRTEADRLDQKAAAMRAGGFGRQEQQTDLERVERIDRLVDAAQAAFDAPVRPTEAYKQRVLAAFDEMELEERRAVVDHRHAVEYAGRKRL